jgi:hypothetical protein
MGDKPLVKHDVCIDLPGEPVNCWADTEITVLLRKHRDVIFDVNLHKGKTYTVETSDDWFYDTKTKRRVKAATFQDGESYHIWISRDFIGFLILKVDGKELQRYSMLVLNTDSHGSDPKVKPEPITIVYGGQSEANGMPQIARLGQPGAAFLGASAWNSSSVGSAWNPGLSPLSTNVPLLNDEFGCRMLLPIAKPTSQPQESQVMHVFEVDVKSIPVDLVNAVETGGEDETAIDTAHVATRNWITGQIIGFAGYIGDNLPWIRELWKTKFTLIRIVHPKAGPKWYLVFKGTIGTRKEISAAKYSVKNTKILAITGGAGTAESMGQAAWRSAKGAVTTKAGVITLVLTIGLDFAEWYHGYRAKQKDFCDLIAKVGIDLAVAGLTAALTSLVVGTIASAAAVTAIPVAFTIAIAVGVAVAVGYIVNYVDKQVHFTDWLAERLRAAAAAYEKYMPTDYNPYSPMFGAMP